MMSSYGSTVTQMFDDAAKTYSSRISQVFNYSEEDFLDEEVLACNQSVLYTNDPDAKVSDFEDSTVEFV